MKVSELNNSEIYYLLKLIDIEMDKCRGDAINLSFGQRPNNNDNEKWKFLGNKRQIIITEINKRISEIE